MPLFLVVVATTVGDHDGYCSGAENEDTVTRQTFYVRYSTHKTNDSCSQSDDEKDGDTKTADEISEALDNANLLFQPMLHGESFYCDRSPSGLMHDFSRKVETVVEIDPADLSDQAISRIIEIE